MPRPPANAPLLNADLILNHALTQIDTAGAERLSLRGLAEKLGVKPNALYHYFASKDDLVEAAYARALSELPLPDPAHNDWREGLKTLATAFWTWCQRHPHFLPLLLRYRAPLHEESRLADTVAALLRQAGIPDAELSPVTDQLIVFFAGSLVMDSGTDTKELTTQQQQFYHQHPERYPTMASLPLSLPDNDQTFALMTRFLIAGIEGLAADAARRPSTRNTP